jgi:MarR family transcriptional regulator, organic hydroperoxide resistance regulator
MSARPKTEVDPRDLDLIVETIIYLQTEGRRQAREQCSRVGITATQLNVLKLLEEIGELSLSELSRRIAAQNSTVTGIVDRMVEAGLVERRQSERDRRVWRITATEKGRSMARKVTVAPWDMLRGALEALDAREKHQLIAILKKVASHVTTVSKEVSDVSRR